MPNNYHNGKIAEYIAFFYLLFHGYWPVSKNYVTGKGTHAGEVDLIFRKRRTLVFVEVKERRSFEKAAYAISEKQKQRIVRGAEAFLSKHKQYDTYDIRFDAILVEYPFKIRHLRNAWVASKLF